MSLFGKPWKVYIFDTVERKDAIKKRYATDEEANKALNRLRRRHPDSPYGRFTILVDARPDGRKRRPYRSTHVYVGD